jgi:hypothetical protein
VQDTLLNRPMYYLKVNHVNTLQQHLDSNIKRKEKEKKQLKTQKLDFTFSDKKCYHFGVASQVNTNKLLDPKFPLTRALT